MQLTPFGLCVRKLRLEYGVTLKDMADGIEIRPAHLSSIEYGEKELTEKHANAVFEYFYRRVHTTERESVRSAIAMAVDQTVSSISLQGLSPENRALIVGLARKLRGLK